MTPGWFNAKYNSKPVDGDFFATIPWAYDSFPLNRKVKTSGYYMIENMKVIAKESLFGLGGTSE